MDYQSFKSAVQGLPVFSGRDAARLGEPKTMYNQLANWRRKGLVSQLRRGLYVLGKADRRIEPGVMFLSGQLYAPSYVSLEYALGVHGLIPELVTSVTAVTTRNTAGFSNDFGRFQYQHIKREAFRGFTLVKDAAGAGYFLALPEKAVVDFIYLNLPRFERGDREVFTRSYRFQNLETLDTGRLKAYGALFANKKLGEIVGGLCRLVREERKR